MMTKHDNTTKLQRAIEILRHEGVQSLGFRTLKYAYNRRIRPYLPLTHPAMYGGVQVANQATALDSWMPVAENPDRSEYKRPNVQLLRKSVRTGDHVVVIGGGVGVTATIAAEELGSSGSIDVYEADEESISAVIDTIELNQVRDQVTLHHAIIGDLVVDSTDLGDPNILSPSQLPSPDVLELDCEGAEQAILSELDSYPREIVVETHGFRGASPKETKNILQELGYQIAEDCAVGKGEEYASDKGAYVLRAIIPDE